MFAVPTHRVHEEKETNVSFETKKCPEPQLNVAKNSVLTSVSALECLRRACSACRRSVLVVSRLLTFSSRSFTLHTHHHKPVSTDTITPSLQKILFYTAATKYTQTQSLHPCRKYCFILQPPNIHRHNHSILAENTVLYYSHQIYTDTITPSLQKILFYTAATKYTQTQSLHPCRKYCFILQPPNIHRHNHSILAENTVLYCSHQIYTDTITPSLQKILFYTAATKYTQTQSLHPCRKYCFILQPPNIHRHNHSILAENTVLYCSHQIYTDTITPSLQKILFYTAATKYTQTQSLHPCRKYCFILQPPNIHRHNHSILAENTVLYCSHQKYTDTINPSWQKILSLGCGQQK